MHRRQRREDDVAHSRVREQPVGECGAVLHRALRRDLIDDVVDAEHGHRDVGRVDALLLHERQRLRRRDAALRDELPRDAHRSRLREMARQISGERELLRHHADARARRVADDQQSQLCALADDAAARPARFGQQRRAPPRANRLRDQHRRQRELQRERHVERLKRTG